MAVGEMVGVLLRSGDWVALRVEEVEGDACGDGVGVKRATLRTRLVSHSVVKRLPTGSMVRPLVLVKRACERHAPLLLPAEPLPAASPEPPPAPSSRQPTPLARQPTPPVPIVRLPTPPVRQPTPIARQPTPPVEPPLVEPNQDGAAAAPEQPVPDAAPVQAQPPPLVVPPKKEETPAADAAPSQTETAPSAPETPTARADDAGAVSEAESTSNDAPKKKKKKKRAAAGAPASNFSDIANAANEGGV